MRVPDDDAARRAWLRAMTFSEHRDADSEGKTEREARISDEKTEGGIRVVLSDDGECQRGNLVLFD